MSLAQEKQVENAIDANQTELLCDTLEMEQLETLLKALGNSVEKFNANGLEKVHAALASL